MHARYAITVGDYPCTSCSLACWPNLMLKRIPPKRNIFHHPVYMLSAFAPYLYCYAAGLSWCLKSSAKDIIALCLCPLLCLQTGVEALSLPTYQQLETHYQKPFGYWQQPLPQQTHQLNISSDFGTLQAQQEWIDLESTESSSSSSSSAGGAAGLEGGPLPTDALVLDAVLRDHMREVLPLPSVSYNLSSSSRLIRKPSRWWLHQGRYVGLLRLLGLRGLGNA